MDELALYQIAITFIPGIGDINGKKLVSYCGGVREVFREKRSALMKVPGVGRSLTDIIQRKDHLVRAEEEIRFMENNGIRALFYLDADYPWRLKHCEDGPMLLFVKGTVMPSKPHVLAVVGTRRPTPYGRTMARQVVGDLKHTELLVVSGLAYGIDTVAHQASLVAELPTVAVLAHGLDTLYPLINRPLAEKIAENGCLVTEFPSGTKLNKDYFPRRNRIIAGLSDAILVIESAEKGGALITAEIALSYNRDVLAVPGRPTDLKSSGCNRLIKTNRAVLVEGAEDIRYQMSWDLPPAMKNGQPDLFVEMSDEEAVIWEALSGTGESAIDEIFQQTRLQPGKLASLLLKMEFEGLIACLPGKRYKKLR